MKAIASPSAFETRIEFLLEQLREASFDVRIWSQLARGIGEAVSSGHCRIGFHPHGMTGPAIRLNALGTSADRRAGRRQSDGSVEAEGVRPCDASMVLAETSSGVWKVEIWSADAYQAKILLSRLGATLTASFQVFRGLRGSGRAEFAQMRDLWDPLPFGVMLVDSHLHLRFANMASDDLLRTRALFRPFGREGAVRPTSQENYAAFCQACEILRDGQAERASFDMLDRLGGAFGEMSVFSLAHASGFPVLPTGEMESGCVVVTLRPFLPEHQARIADRRSASLAFTQTTSLDDTAWVRSSHEV